MHTISYASNEISRDEGALQEYGTGIFVWGIGIGSHDDEEYERGEGRARVELLGGRQYSKTNKSTSSKNRRKKQNAHRRKAFQEGRQKIGHEMSSRSNGTEKHYPNPALSKGEVTPEVFPRS